MASFASHIHRVSQVVEAAKAHDRLVGVSGRSMIRNVQIARELGYLDLPQEMMVASFHHIVPSPSPGMSSQESR